MDNVDEGGVVATLEGLYILGDIHMYNRSSQRVDYNKVDSIAEIQEVEGNGSAGDNDHIPAVAFQ
jgi:hypothetical protein